MIARKPIAGIVLFGSIAVHSGVLVGLPPAPSEPPVSAALVTEFDIASASPEPEPSPGVAADSTAAPVTPSVARSPARERAINAPIAPDREVKAAELPPSLVTSDEPTAPIDFVMTVGPASSAKANVSPAAPGTGSERQGDAVYAEEGVDARPRLLNWQAPRYPPSAASAGVEVDVPVDVVIDTEGSVTDVRLPRHFGYGLDEAAAAAARSYHFSRGLRGGQAVRVRMRCTVMFRLN
jgi:protein TonB